VISGLPLSRGSAEFIHTQEHAMSDSYIVAFYSIDREYGGPEEGGWWYDSGSLVRVFAVTKSKSQAYRMAGRANDLLHQQQRQLPSIGSVMYAGNRFGARVYRNQAPEHFPSVTPHYE